MISDKYYFLLENGYPIQPGSMCKQNFSPNIITSCITLGGNKCHQTITISGSQFFTLP